MKLTDKVAVITGGTRGIGYAVAKRFALEGAKVVICGSRQESADRAVEKLKGELPEAQVFGIAPKLTDREQMKSAMKQVEQLAGPIDILVNNAGISQSQPLSEYTDKDIDAILDLNVKAGVVCSQAAAEEMINGEREGVILFTSSVVSFYGQPSGCCYPASKSAVNGLVRSLARELAPKKIRVNAVAPGVIRTDMVANLPEAMIAPIIAKIPLGRMGEGTDIANAFAFLASDDASYITGAILPVDGGVII